VRGNHAWPASAWDSYQGQLVVTVPIPPIVPIPIAGLLITLLALAWIADRTGGRVRTHGICDRVPAASSDP
jgi:hypothetical protein